MGRQQRHQKGYVYEANSSFHIRFYENGIQKSKFLCAKDTKHHSRTCKAVQNAAVEFMRKINAGQVNDQRRDMRVCDFWETRYVPHHEQILPLTGQPRKKPSTMRGYKQIWRQHLKNHFGNITIQQYGPHQGNRFLRSLTGTQGKTTLKHIKALGTAIFSFAVEEEIITVNPWHEVK